MVVEFTLRRPDAQSAIKEIKANRGREGSKDTLHVLVSEFRVTSRSVGTESVWPVNGIRPRPAQPPIPVWEKATDTRASSELQMRIGDGEVFCAKAVVRHGVITLGAIPDTGISVPIKVTPLDLLLRGPHPAHPSYPFWLAARL